MQTILYVLAKSPKQQSLREAVLADLKKWQYDGLWEIVSEHTKGRNAGWSKIKRRDSNGALNINWDADAKTLIGRVVSKGGNHSSELVGAFVGYLLREHGKKISGITMRTI